MITACLFLIAHWLALVAVCFAFDDYLHGSQSVVSWLARRSRPQAPQAKPG